MGRKIGELVGHPPDNRSYSSSSLMIDDVLVGVEVELEGMKGLQVDPHHPIEFSKYWNVVHDGSLRDNGVEFVLKHPLSGKDLIHSLMSLERDITDGHYHPKFSDRTSVHIHLDVRNMTMEELRNLIILYTMFEKVLFRYAGAEREDNIFCASFGNSQEIIRMLNDQFTKDENHFHMQLGAFQKYSSCNLSAVRAHGSLEFRQHYGDFKATHLLRWINILLSMHRYARMKRMVPKNIPAEISKLGLTKFTTMVFGKYVEHLKYEDMEKDIMDGIRLAQDLIHYKEIEVEGTNDEGTLFAEYLKKLGKDMPRAKKYEGHLQMPPGVNMAWADIIFDDKEEIR